MRLLITLSLLLLVAPFSEAQVRSFANLNKKIRSAGAQWEAGPTSVSHLSTREVRLMLDPKLDPHPEVQFEVPESSEFRVMATASQVTAWDWRNKDGKNWLSPIRNQGQCGSCLAFAAAATMESQYRISKNSSSSSIRLSPQFMFSCGGGKCSQGWYPEKAAQFLKSTGVTDDSCMPYMSSAGSDISCKKACSNYSSRTVKISSYSRPTESARSLSALRAALQKGPLVTTMSVYGDFMNYRRGIYKHVSGSYVGGHAIALVGFNDKDRYFIIRNSWGTTWGESGYARISYDDSSNIGAATWKYEMAPATRVFALPLLNASIDSVSKEDTAQERDIASVDSAEPNFSLSRPLSTMTANTTFEMTLENRDGVFAGNVEFHQVHKGKDKTITIPMSSQQLQIRVNTSLLATGDWEFYVSAKDSRGQTVMSEKQSVNIEP
jgi:C1A family cysteine protease